jgi:Domain of Unknown Function (DUF1080)
MIPRVCVSSLFGIALVASAKLLCSDPTIARTQHVPQKPVPRAWKPLFNGRDLEGWEVVNTGRWTVEDGAIVMRRVPGNYSGGWLYTKKDYGDFILRLKFKPGTDSFHTGILIRDPGHGRIGRPGYNGYEISVAQTIRNENTNGAIYYLANAYVRKIAAEEWATFEVRCRGDHIVAFMNGEKMAETHSRRSFRGGIGLHLHGGNFEPEYRWRDIEILELPEAPHEYRADEEKLATADGQVVSVLDSELLESGSARLGDRNASWIFENGVLRGTGAAKDAWLVTKQSYGNLMLTFDFRMSAGGQAGLSVHVPLVSAEANDSALDAKSLFAHSLEYRITDNEEEPASSILGLARAFNLDSCEQRVYRPKAWNQAQVFASGDHFISYLNEHKEVDFHSDRSAPGALAFHVGAGATVEYRNIMIKPVP